MRIQVLLKSKSDGNKYNALLTNFRCVENISINRKLEYSVILNLCQNGQQLLFPLCFPSFHPPSRPSFLHSFPSLFAYSLLPFGFSQEHFGLKPFSFWEKPKGRRQKAKGWWRGWGRREEGGRRRKKKSKKLVTIPVINWYNKSNFLY